MKASRLRGWLWLLPVVALAVWLAVTAAGSGDGAEWVTAEHRDLVLAVEVSGELESEASSLLGPPQVSELWNFRIAFMAPEGRKVQPGMPVLGFDTTELNQKLLETTAERDTAEKTLEKRATDLRVQRQQEQLQLAEAEARLRRSALEVTVPEELTEGKTLQAARIDHATAETETAYRRHRLEELQRSADAELAALRQARDRAATRVQEIQQQIAAMTVTAPRAGTVIYVSNWRGEKKKVGDSCWRAEKAIEIPDLTRMRALGEVDEAQAGRLAAGQPVSLVLDAFPDETLTGTVQRIRRSVQQKSWRNPVKVVRLEIALNGVDSERMRPGMRFRGSVEVERVASALVIPLHAVVPTPEGAFVTVRTSFGRRQVEPRLGRRNGEWVEVLGGLEAGQQVLADAAARHREAQKEGAADAAR